MPIEIKELSIRVSVTPTQDGAQDNQGGNPGNSVKEEGSGQEDIIAACVEQVMERIKDKLER
jgi:hypothetical protein